MDVRAPVTPFPLLKRDELLMAFKNSSSAMVAIIWKIALHSIKQVIIYYFVADLDWQSFLRMLFCLAVR